jgi:hypothetical protein
VDGEINMVDLQAENEKYHHYLERIKKAKEFL